MNRSTISNDTPAPAPGSLPIRRAELTVVLVLCLIGAGLRFAFPSRMAIEHFDEGVYASNLLLPDQDYRYPDRHLYAPSLVPALIEWSIIAFGDKGIAPMLPSLLFGTLTIPLIWLVGRQWFGPLAGIAAATLLSLSDFHIAFSRSALTDVPLCFWLLSSVYLFERAFRDLSWHTAVAAGVTTGLAWWTKYNGWLPLAISLTGVSAWSLFARRDERHFLRHLALWAVAALTALLVWSPYWLSLPNGYAEVARNHSQYVVGIAGWNSGWIRQQDALEAFNSPLSWGGLVVTIVGIGMMWKVSSLSFSNPLVGLDSQVSKGQWAAFLVASVIAVMVLSANRLMLVMAIYELFLGIAVTAVLWVKRWQHGNAEFTIGTSSSAGPFMQFVFQRSDWLLAAWVIGLSVTVPLYRPYPRLPLPWLIGVVLLVSRLVTSHFRDVSNTQTWKDRLGSWILFGLVLIGFWIVDSKGPAFVESFVFRCWEMRSQFREIACDATRDALKAAQAAKQKPIQNTRAVLYVYAEPGLFFNLPTDGLAVQPAGNLDFVEIEATRKLPTFLVTGPHAHRSKAFADEFAKRADQFELIASYPYDASDFVRLDEVGATQLRAQREPLEVRLFRVK